MNRYEYKFAAICPKNKRTIFYELVLESDEMVYVEDIIMAAESQPNSYHEPLADFLHKKLGGRQTLTAHHHGVDITTVRG